MLTFYKSESGNQGVLKDPDLFGSDATTTTFYCGDLTHVPPRFLQLRSFGLRGVVSYEHPEHHDYTESLEDGDGNPIKILVSGLNLRIGNQRFLPQQGLQGLPANYQYVFLPRVRPKQYASHSLDGQRQRLYSMPDGQLIYVNGDIRSSSGKFVNDEDGPRVFTGPRGDLLRELSVYSVDPCRDNSACVDIEDDRPPSERNQDGLRKLHIFPDNSATLDGVPLEILPIGRLHFTEMPGVRSVKMTEVSGLDKGSLV